MNWGRVGSWVGGSCLRRNDGWGAGMTERAGATEVAGGMEVWRRDRGKVRLVGWLVASDPPPNLPPSRGEG